MSQSEEIVVSGCTAMPTAPVKPKGTFIIKNNTGPSIRILPTLTGSVCPIQFIFELD